MKPTGGGLTQVSDPGLRLPRDSTQDRCLAKNDPGVRQEALNAAATCSWMGLSLE
jgi:hypothetical protein